MSKTQYDDTEGTQPETTAPINGVFVAKYDSIVDEINQLTIHDPTTEVKTNFAGYDSDGYDEDGYNPEGVHRDGHLRPNWLTRVVDPHDQLMTEIKSAHPLHHVTPEDSETSELTGQNDES
jgi:hypothetical protein